LELAQQRKQFLISLGFHADVIHIHPDDCDEQRASYGCKVLGSYIGSSEFVENSLNKKIEELDAECKALSNFSNMQGKFLMLKWSFCQKANFILRTTPPSQTTAFCTAFEKLKKDVLSSILNFTDGAVPPQVWAQAVLNVSDGGLGLQNTPHVAYGAYAASVVECRRFVNKICHEFIVDLESLQGVTGGLLKTCIDHINADSGPVAPERLLSYDRISDLAESRSKDSEFTVQSRLNDWFKSKRIDAFQNTVEDCHRLAWFTSLRDSTAGKWLETCPKTDKFNLTNSQFVVSLRYRLMLDQPLICEGSKCSCIRRPLLDTFGHHLATACGKDGCRIATHDSIVLVLKEMLGRAGLVTKREEIGCFQEQFPESNERPDLSVLNFPNRPKIVLDVQVTCPVSLRTNMSRVKAIEPGRAAAVSFKAKTKKYSALCAANGLEFLPFIIESTGRLHARAEEFVKKVVDIMSESTGISNSILTSFWMGRLSLCLQQQISSAIISRARRINGGRCALVGFDGGLNFIGSFPVLQQ
jgi:hypothetical protein